MTDTGPRALIRKDLRDYDNPKSGRNSNYQNRDFMLGLLDKYKFANEEAMRAYSVERKHRRQS